MVATLLQSSSQWNHTKCFTTSTPQSVLWEYFYGSLAGNAYATKDN